MAHRLMHAYSVASRRHTAICSDVQPKLNGGHNFASRLEPISRNPIQQLTLAPNWSRASPTGSKTFQQFPPPKAQLDGNCFCEATFTSHIPTGWKSFLRNVLTLIIGTITDVAGDNDSLASCGMKPTSSGGYVVTSYIDNETTSAVNKIATNWKQKRGNYTPELMILRRRTAHAWIRALLPRSNFTQHNWRRGLQIPHRYSQVVSVITPPSQTIITATFGIFSAQGIVVRKLQ